MKNHMNISIAREKAYDKIQYPLIIKTFSKSENFLHPIKSICIKHSPNIIFNEKTLGLSFLRPETGKNVNLYHFCLIVYGKSWTIG